MKKVLQTLSSVLTLLVLAAAVFVGGYVAGSRPPEAAPLRTENSREKGDWKLPGEQRRQVVTQEEVTVQISRLAELATYCGEYAVTETTRCSRYFLEDVIIPGTTNTLTLRCCGVVKVGYDVQAIVPTVDNRSQIIYIALPEPEVLDNYIIWDSVECLERNNILNPLDFSRYQSMISEMERKGLEQVEREGIYTAAEEQVKTVLSGFLAGFDEYEVVFL